MILLWSLLLTQAITSDTLVISPAEMHVEPGDISARVLGEPQVEIPTGQGTASVWLRRFRDTVFVAAVIPDTTRYWGDDFVMSIDTRGDAASNPQHDDFQLYFRRVTDSSVVFRGRNGRWAYPRDDPDWRLGAERTGGGWSVQATESQSGWMLLLKLDRAWFRGEDGQLPRVAFRIYDDSPGGWYAWPPPDSAIQAKAVENSPALWVPVRFESAKL